MIAKDARENLAGVDVISVGRRRSFRVAERLGISAMFGGKKQQALAHFERGLVNDLAHVTTRWKAPLSGAFFCASFC